MTDLEQLHNLTSSLFIDHPDMIHTLLNIAYLMAEIPDNKFKSCELTKVFTHDRLSVTVKFDKWSKS